ncbi:MAG: hypothetical protein Kow0080_28500 [Candidatus Promineifilaceae bacterium]
MHLTDLSGRTIVNYTLEKRLYERPSSALYLARHNQSNNPVFIELLYTDPENNPDAYGRFHRRMETVAQLHHPGIVPILEVGKTPDNLAYAVIAHTNAAPLAQKLKAGQYHPSPVEALQTAVQLAEILATAHPAGIFHHDLRPENIYVQENGRIQLLDLGVPIHHTPASPEKLKMMTTLDYAAPEQLEGKPLSGRSNIYSLGVILYELLAGQPPPLPRSEWDVTTRAQLPKEIPLEEVKPELTPETYRVVEKCLWHAEWSRYPTIADLIADLDLAIAAEKAAENAPPPRKRPFTRTQLLIVGGLILLMLIIITAVLLQRGG